MKAMIFTKVGEPLTLQEVDCPEVGPHQVLIRVHVCAICRTDLHIIEGELKSPKLPLILGHQIVGTIEKMGSKVQHFHLHERVGIPWLQKSCAHCEYCDKGAENLCDSALFTGYQVNGGYAEYCVVDAHALYRIPDQYDDLHAAPLLCAGFIGYRAYKKTNGAKNIAFYGFGSSAHILTQIVQEQGGKIYAFTRDGDLEKQEFAKKRGAVWAGGSSEKPPILLDAAIIFAPVGSLVVDALKVLKKGAPVICAGIHMTPIPSFPYSLLWEERKITSVANLTHKDGEEFMEIASKMKIETQITSYPLEKANEALADLKRGKGVGSFVLEISNR